MHVCWTRRLHLTNILRLAFFGILLFTLASCDMVNNGLKGTIGGLKSRTLAELPDADINIKEGEGSTLTLLLNPPPKDAIKVTWTLTDPNTRAVASSGIVNVGSGQTSASIYIQARLNALIDGDEQLRLLISSAGLQSELETLITILDQTTPAALSITDAPLYDYGAVRVGLQNTRNFTVTNSGDASASLILASGLSAPFTFLGGSYPGTAGTCAATLLGHTSCTLIVEYAPTASGSFTDSLSLSYNNGAATQNTPLNVQGTAAVVVAAFNNATLPANPSNLTVLNTEVNGSGITNYRYKIIQSSGDCTDSTGYSASRPVATRITDNISLLPEGNLEICVVGANVTLWQPYSAPTIYTWTKDTTAPSAPSVAIAGGANYTTTLIETLTTSATDAADMYVTNTAGCSSGGAWEPYATTKTGWSLATANSTNTVYVGFRDLAGNSICSSDSIVHDNLNPGIIPSLALGAAGVGLTDSPSISFPNATDNGPSGIASYQAQIFRTSDNAVIKSWTSLISGDSFSALSLADGVSYYVQVRATDNAGNIGLTRTSGNWTAFANIIATLSGTPAAISNVTSLNVNVGGTGVSGYSYKLGDAATTDCTSATGYSVTRAIGTNITDSISSLSDGTLKLCAVGTDGSSWQSYASATTYTWTKDTVAPTAPSVLIAANATYITNLSTFLDLSVSSANEMYVTPVLGCGSGGAWEAFSISKAYTFSNANATNTIYAKFRDTALNETSCVNDSVIHDGSNPNAPTSLSLGTTPSSLSQAPAFSYTLATDVGPSGINFHEARILKNSDSSEVLTWAAFTSGTSLSGLSLVQNEVYKFEVRAVDNAGNIGTSASSSTWIASGPVTAILSGQPTGTNNTTTLNATVSGTGVTQYKYKFGTSTLDCAVASGYSASSVPTATLITDSLSGLADGGIKLCVVGYNGAVWQDYAAATITTWTKDTAAPTLPTISINTAATYTNSTASTLTLSATAADEMYVTNTAGCASGGAWEPYGTTKAWTLGQTNSTATVYISFKDTSGNTTSCINDTIVHDAQNPNAATSLVLGTIPASVTASPSISYTAASDVGPAGIDRHQVSIFKTSDNSIVSVYADHSTGTNVSGLTLVDGQQYYAKVRALDNAGNIGLEAQTANWTVNGSLAATLAGTPSNPSSATVLNVTVGGTGVNEYKYKVGLTSIDCTAAAGYSAPTPIATLITDSVAGLSDGTLKLCAVGGDGLGAFQAYASATSFTWVKDTVAPTSPGISINAAAAYTNSTAATLALSATGSPADMYVTNTVGCASGGVWEPYGTTKAWTLGQTNNTATVYASFRDAAGNSTGCVNDTIIHDSVSPGDPTGLSIGAVPAKLYQSPTLTYTPGTDSGSGIQKHQVQLTKTSDNSVIAAYADFVSANSLTGLSLTSGTQYYFKLKTFDNAGNLSNEVNSANFTALAPTAILTGHPTSTNDTTVLNITVSGTDVTQYKYKVGTGTLDCTVASGYSGSAINIATLITDNISGLADGTVKLCAVGGNGTDWQDYSSATIATWTKDTTAPSLPALTINGATAGYTTSTASTLAPFAVGADNMYITTVAGCGSGGVFEAYATSKAYTLTANTINTVYIKFSDTSGNVSSCVSASSTHDNQNPNAATSLTLGGTPQGLTTTPTLSFTAASDVGPAGIQKYQARLIKTSDSTEVAVYADFTNGSQLTGLSLLDNTQYRFELKAFDNAGNVSTTVQSSSFTTYTAVTATLSGTPANPSNATTLNVTVAGSGVSGYSYKVGLSSIDCTSASGYSGTIAVATLITDSISGLADGSLKLCVVGNNGTQTQAYASATTYSWVKDTTPPQITNITASSNGPFKAGDVITFTVTFSEAATASTPANARLVNSTPTTVTSTYSSGSGTTSWIFTYTVLAGDNYADLQLDRVLMTSGSISDALSNSTTPITWSSNLATLADVVIDTTTPTVPTISINSAATYTNSTASTLTLSASGADKMYVTNVAGCASGGVLENYATSKAWTLGQTNGTATVYIQYSDLAGNTTACVNDTIVHDSIAPGDPTALTLGAVPAKLYESPTLTFTSGTDAVSGINNHQVQVHKTADNSIVKVYANFTSGATVTGLSLTAGTQYYFKLKTFDNAGNVSNEVSSGNWTANAPTATLSGTPTNPSNATTLAVTVGGTDITFYAYKVGVAASTDCTVSAGYSSSIPIATVITDSVSGLADGSLKLCVIGSNGTDWQTYAAATNYSWVKDTVLPYKNQLALGSFSPPQWSVLSAYYAFDGNLNDSSINGYNLSAVNGLASTTSPKIFGTESGSFQIASSRYGINNSFPHLDQLSASVWFYKSSDSDYQRVVSSGSGWPNEEWKILASSTGSMTTEFKGPTATCYGANSSTLALNQWHHLIFSFNGSAIRTWVNGVRLPDAWCAQPNLVTTGPKLLVGAEGQPASFFNGNIDDLALWNTALSDTEAETIYNSQGPSLFTIAGNAHATQTTAVALNMMATGADLMYVTNTAGCSSGGVWEAYTATKSWTLTTSNSTNTVYAQFKDGAGNVSACVNDTIIHDNQNPNVPTALTLGATPVGLTQTPTLSFTIQSDVGLSLLRALQVQVQRTSDNAIIAPWADTASDKYVAGLSLTDGVQYYFALRAMDRAGNVSTTVNSSSWTVISSITATLSGTPTNPSNTTTLAVTVGGTNVTNYAYKVGLSSIDCANATGYSGTISAATNITNSVSGLADGSLKLCVIGSNGTDWQTYASATSYTWTKDTVSPYKNQLALGAFSPPQWSNITAYYPFDGNLNDGTLNANHLTAVNTMTTGTPALLGSGAAQVVRATSKYARNLSFPHLTSFTASTWIYKNTNNAYSRILAKGSAYPNDWDIEADTGGTLVANIKTASGTCTSLVSPALALSQWHHVLLSYDGTRYYFWVNGTLVNTAACQGPVVNNASQIYVGADPAGSDVFNGAIEDIGIWSTALTEAETEQVYTAQNSSFMAIAGNVRASNTTSVTINNYVTAADQMYITNTAGCSSGGVWETYAATKGWTLTTANATNTVYAQYRDTAGNTSACVNDTIIHDNGNPNAATALTLSTVPVGLTTTPTLTWTSSTDVGPSGIKVYQTQLKKTSDNLIMRSWQDFEKLNQFTGLSLADGVQYYFEVRAVDWAGNYSTVATSANWTAMSSITATLGGTPSNPSNVTTLAITVGGTNVTGYAYKVGLASIDCTSAAGYSGTIAVATNITNSVAGLADGSLKVCVVGTNGSSWQTYASATSYTWAKDTTAPTGTLTTSSPSPTATAPIPMTLTLSEPLTTDLVLANFTFTNGTVGSLVKVSSTSYTFSITPSSSTVTVSAQLKVNVATDIALNSNTASNTLSVSYDSVVPSVAITSPSAGSSITVVNQASYTVSGTCSENGINVVISGTVSGSTTCSANVWSQSLNFSAAAAGTVTVTATQTRTSGTTGSDTRTFTKYANRAPQLNTASNQIVTEGSAIAAIDFNDTNTSNDTDIDTQTISYTCIYDTVIDAAVAGSTACTTISGLTFNAATGQIGWTTAINQAGSYEFKVTGSDGTLTDNKILNIVVDPYIVATLANTPETLSVEANLAVTVGGINITNYKFKVGAAGSTDCTVAAGYSGSAIAIATSITNAVSSFGPEQSVKLCVVGQHSNGTWQAYASATSYQWTQDILTTVETASAYTEITEGNGNTAQSINLAITNPKPSAMTVYYKISGTAVNGVDHNLATGSLVIAASSTTASIPFTLYGNALTDGDKSIVIALYASNKKFLNFGTNAQLYTILIKDDETTILPSTIYSKTQAGHFCMLLSNGKIKCWGRNNNGQVGDGTTTERSSPVAVDATITYTKINSGFDHNCGITTAGVLKCWGSNFQGKLGDSTQTASSTPVIFNSGTTYSEASPGPNHTCAITTGGVLKCAGYNVNAQLGDGTRSDILTPAVIDSGVSYSKISSGQNNSCGITTANVLKCWGNNTTGAVGDGTGTGDSAGAWRLGPTVVDSGVSYKNVFASFDFACGITSTDAVKCWGYNANGQLGTAGTTNQLAPVVVDSGITYATLANGVVRTCGITTAGVLKCWGTQYIWSNSDTQVANVTTPTVIDSGTTYVSVAVGRDTVCGITTSKTIKCHGHNRYSNLGLGKTSWLLSATSMDTSVATVSTSDMSACKITTGGALYCLGTPASGLTVGDGTSSVRPGFVAIDATSVYSSLSVRDGSYCGITTTGVLKCWGSNSNGQIGDGTTTTALVPKVIDAGVSYSSVSAGKTTCGITSTNVLKCWGSNVDGTVGDVSNTDRLTPTVISSGTNFLSVSTGSGTACAVTSANVLRCWGKNSIGQLGDSTTANKNTPTTIDSGITYSSVTVGSGNLASSNTHVCGITTGSALKCWGLNGNGQLGDTTTTTRTTPTLIDSGTLYTAIALGKDSTCGITSTSKLRCWGNGAYGKLASGSASQNATPATMDSATNYVKIAIGGSHGFGVTDTGALKTWGYLHNLVVTAGINENAYNPIVNP